MPTTTRRVGGRWPARVRDEAARVGRPIAVSFDLAGPKLRTGPLQAGPRIVKGRPERERRRNGAPAGDVWFTPLPSPTTAKARTGHSR